jgi:hypothetical protein
MVQARAVLSIEPMVDFVKVGQTVTRGAFRNSTHNLVALLINCHGVFKTIRELIRKS